MTENSLVTFAIISYKQEHFITEAVLSAFAQTYSPLEIVISDDCSPDSTYEIIEKLVADYRGPHKIRLNQNKKNMGLAGNVNKMWELSSGELLVIQGGDDISVPKRTEIMVEAWKASMPPVDMLYSNITVIDESGKVIEQRKETRPISKKLMIRETLTGKKTFVIGGCSAAYSRDIHSKAGPLDSKVVAEDFVYSFRALLGNGVTGIEEPLVKYRINSNSIIGTFEAGAIGEKKLLVGQQAILNEYKKALNCYGFNNAFLRWRLGRRINTFQLNINSYEMSTTGRLFLCLYAALTFRLRLFVQLLKKIPG